MLVNTWLIVAPEPLDAPPIEGLEDIVQANVVFATLDVSEATAATPLHIVSLGGVMVNPGLGNTVICPFAAGPTQVLIVAWAVSDITADAFKLDETALPGIVLFPWRGIPFNPFGTVAIQDRVAPATLELRLTSWVVEPEQSD